MSETMLERMAKALCASVSTESRWDRLSYTAQDSYRKHARAALEAIKEPSQEVCRAVPGYECKNPHHIDLGKWVGGCDQDGFMPDAAFTAMIQAILDGK